MGDTVRETPKDKKMQSRTSRVAWLTPGTWARKTGLGWQVGAEGWGQGTGAYVGGP